MTDFLSWSSATAITDRGAGRDMRFGLRQTNENAEETDGAHGLRRPSSEGRYAHLKMQALLVQLYLNA